MIRHFAPYHGPQRTLSTTLSADECVRRLRDDVLPPRYGAPGRWQRLWRDPNVSRSITKSHFKLRKHPFYSRLGPWYFFGSISSQGTETLITGSYHLDRGETIAWYAYALLPLLGAGSLVALRIGHRILPELVPVGLANNAWLFIIVAVCSTFIPVLLWRNRHERANEAYLITFLKQFYSAHEQGVW